jgi:hypothetical protein
MRRVLQLIYRITIPGLSVKRDFLAARERLLADCPEIHEVIATTSAATLLVVHSGPADPSRWAQTLCSLLSGRRATGIGIRPSRRAETFEDDDSAA